MTRKRVLAVLPALDAICLPNGNIVLQGRFISGMDAYARFWDGELLAIMEPAPPSALQSNMDRTLAGDNVEVNANELNFGVKVVDYHSSGFEKVLAECDLVLAGVYYRQNHVADLARRLGIGVIYNSEYTLKTRLQIQLAQENHPAIKARRIVWEINQERLHRHALSRADGLQANGVPTYEAYRHLTKNPMLFFDGRLLSEKLIQSDVLEEKLKRIVAGGPLRLTWSGRLNKMKGADQLLEVAHHLRKMGVDFTLDIYGGGLLAESMKARIAEENMAPQVRLNGYIPFDELTAKTQREYDLWVCCHPQGDPSGAYLETLGNGLPIVGYDNEALTGVLERVPAGRTVPIYEAESLARLIQDLAGRRRQIGEWARTAVSFARNHTLDRTFKRRVDHFDEVLATRTSPRRSR